MLSVVIYLMGVKQYLCIFLYPGIPRYIWVKPWLSNVLTKMSSELLYLLWCTGVVWPVAHHLMTIHGETEAGANFEDHQVGDDNGEAEDQNQYQGS